MPSFEALLDRVDRLLFRYEEAQRRQALLESQLNAVTLERDSLRSRLAAARGRIDALLDRLPADAAAVPASASEATAEATQPAAAEWPTPAGTDPVAEAEPLTSDDASAGQASHEPARGDAREATRT